MPSSPKCTGYCGPADTFSSPTSPTVDRSRPRPSATSISGPPELPVACRAQAGRKCSSRPASSTFATAPKSTRSAAPPARTEPGPTTSTATRSSRGSPPRIGRRKEPGMALTRTVIHPPRDVARHLELAAKLGAEVVATLDTHVHADYVSGATELALLGADAIVPSGSSPRWGHRTIDADETLAIGDMVLRAIPTPGHTPEHLAYALEVSGRTEAVFTGGSLILGGAARTDLLG